MNGTGHNRTVEAFLLLEHAMNTLCVIIARRGSLGLPNKNELLVAGRPMLDWTIAQALGSRWVDRVVLSTDGLRLAEIGHTRGIDVVMRPAHLAHETTTIDDAARHGFTMIEREEGCQYARAVVLYGNVPVRPLDLTDRAIEKLEKTGADSVQSVYPVEKIHPYWMKRIDGDRLEMYEPNNIYRRQDLPPVYMLNGGVIAVMRSSFMTTVEGEPHAFLGEDRRAIVTGPNEVIDVDSHLELQVAEEILLQRQMPNLRVTG